MSTIIALLTIMVYQLWAKFWLPQTMEGDVLAVCSRLPWVDMHANRRYSRHACLHSECPSLVVVAQRRRKRTPSTHPWGLSVECKYEVIPNIIDAVLAAPPALRCSASLAVT